MINKIFIQSYIVMQNLCNKARIAYVFSKRKNKTNLESSLYLTYVTTSQIFSYQFEGKSWIVLFHKIYHASIQKPKPKWFYLKMIYVHQPKFTLAHGQHSMPKSCPRWNGDNFLLFNLDQKLLPNIIITEKNIGIFWA